MRYEVELLKLWRQLLKSDAMAQTHFFNAGGNSLLAVKLAQDVEDLTGLHMDLRDVVAHPTPRALAAWLREIGGGAAGSRGIPGERPAATTATRTGPSAFADWGAALTCYTSALGVYLAADDDRWWRVLADGGPYLAVSPAPDGLLRFEHHRSPPARMIGLRARGADDWAAAWAGIRHELDTFSRVIVAADAWNVPWLTACGRRHAPHWFVLTRDDADGYLVDDPLDHVDDHGRQHPVRVHLDEHEVRRCCGALIDPPPHLVLREQAALGTSAAAFGAAYRWLVHGDCAPGHAAAQTRHGALELAELFDRAAADPASYVQADDIWQGLRQRELLIRVLEIEDKLGELGGLPPREPWERSAVLWRRLPPLLMHAQLLASRGTSGDSAKALVETFRAIAEAESRLDSFRLSVAVMS
jgi:hypothetical protein